MYKRNMTSSDLNTIPVKSLKLHPDIHIRYCEILPVIHMVFTSKSYHNSRPVVNEIFKKHELAILLLSPDELAALNRFKAFKKQIEWLSGRFLIKHMFKQFCAPDEPLENINLAYLDEGAPYVTLDPDIPISLSHSNDLSAAAVSTKKNLTFGIDLEIIKPMPDAYFLKTAFTQNEIEQFTNDPHEVFRNWTIKEAFLKYIKKGFNESLHRVEILDNTIFHNRKKIDLDIRSVCLDDKYYLSLVCDP